MNRFVRGGAWEFVPYNDPESAPISADALRENVKVVSQAFFKNRQNGAFYSTDFAEKALSQESFGGDAKQLVAQPLHRSGSFT